MHPKIPTSSLQAVRESALSPNMKMASDDNSKTNKIVCPSPAVAPFSGSTGLARVVTKEIGSFKNVLQSEMSRHAMETTRSVLLAQQLAREHDKALALELQLRRLQEERAQRLQSSMMLFPSASLPATSNVLSSTASPYLELLMARQAQARFPLSLSDRLASSVLPGVPTLFGQNNAPSADLLLASTAAQRQAATLVEAKASMETSQTSRTSDSSPRPLKRPRVEQKQPPEASGDIDVDGNQSDSSEGGSGQRFRRYQYEQWTEKFQELCDYRKRRGHCQVPHTFQDNLPLARWVKRQRYQYKLKAEGKISTMTDERIRLLEEIGFIWDSHAAAWAEKLHELEEYEKVKGDCNVPSTYPLNPQLATWVKCQRRQFKLSRTGKTSNMTKDRIEKLVKLGFRWEVRKPWESTSTHSIN